VPGSTVFDEVRAVPARGPPERRRVRAELDGLAALLESHFGYEEKRLVSALNALEAPRWEAAPPDFLLTSPDPGPGP
jgi:hypothetical protein